MIHGVIYIDNEPYPITNMFNAEAEPTEIVNEVVTVVARIANDEWLAVEVEPDEIKPIQ